jgi:hypothetical protein
MNESDASGNFVTLPSKTKRQSVHGYVHEHLEAFERALSFGVPYQTLIEAMLVAGFVKVNPRSIETAVYRARRKPLTRVACCDFSAIRSVVEPWPFGFEIVRGDT